MTDSRIVSRRVISLADSERINGFLRQPSGGSFEVFRAVDGRKGEGFELFSNELHKNMYGVEPSPPVIGCAVSHVRLLEEFVTSDASENDFILIAEDDARFSHNIEKFLEEITKFLNPDETILLATPFSSKDQRNYFSHDENACQQSFISKDLVNRKYKLASYDGTAWGTGLYLMSKKSATKYIDWVNALGRIHWVADDWAYISSKCDFSMKVVRPNLASWEGASSVQSEEKDPGSPRAVTLIGKVRERVGIRTRLYRFRSRLAATAFDLSEMLSPRR